jgi:hypothetical protein
MHHDAKLGELRLQGLQPRARRVAASVIDEDDFVGDASERRSDLQSQWGCGAFFVEHGNDDGNV